MAKNKTHETIESVNDFIAAVDNEQKRKDSYRLIELMRELTGCEPKMWGPSIIGFGSYHYKYDSGHEGTAPVLGFSPRKAAISLYVYVDTEHSRKILPQLGKFTMGKSCIYVKKLSDVNEAVIAELANESVTFVEGKYKRMA
ncbi:MAG: hypothetical protein K0R65_1769 [Crocinitomicaceae bacterium]|jgi:hypothetical protein|nr:hypothetical protein [Crocinitomicaceae bacterium]